MNQAGKTKIDQSRRKAVVIGGSVAGLLAARVLSSHYESVLILERDPVASAPVARKGQPHALHTHVLLGKGFEIINRYFPGFRESLKNHGADLIDFSSEAEFYSHGDRMKNFHSGSEYAVASRPLIESIIREELLKRPNVNLKDNCKTIGLQFSEDKGQVDGVLIEDRADGKAMTIDSDLVVDASGRGSRIPRWLEENGYRGPKQEKINIDVGYATRLYRRDPDAATEHRMICITPEGGKELTGGCLVPIEGNRWICTLSGWGGKHASAEEKEFMTFARHLPTDSLANSIKDLTPESDILIYKYPASLRRRYEQLKSFPRKLLVLGDAVCSFNPIYGQGMTSSALQAMSLDKVLQRCPGLPDARQYFRQSAKYVSRAWTMSAVSDFQHKTTTGNRPWGTGLINYYMQLVQKAAHRDACVYGAFLRVTNLIDPPIALFKPEITLRVVWSWAKRKLHRLKTLCGKNINRSSVLAKASESKQTATSDSATF